MGSFGRINVSVFTPLCLGGFDAAISCLLFKTETKSSGERRRRVWCEWWNNDLCIQLRAWLEETFPRIQFVDAHRWTQTTYSYYILHSLKENTLFFPFFFLTIELFCLSLHFRLGKTWRLVCIQIINLDLLLEGERLICYVLETPFDFPFFFFFRGGETCLFCLACLFSSKGHWLLTSPVSNLWPQRPGEPLIILTQVLAVHHGIWSPWAKIFLTSLEMSFFCWFARFISAHMELVGKGQLIYNKLVSCSNSHCFWSLR